MNQQHATLQHNQYGDTVPVADAPKVLFVVHQIGSQADGGIKSISEIIARTPGLKKWVVTNIASNAEQGWHASSQVLLWPMAETQYGERRRRVIGAIRQNIQRLVNNIRTYRMVTNARVDVVHINDHRAFWSAALGAKLAGAKVILNVRDSMREGARSHFRWRLCLALCDCFLVLSAEMIEHWRRTLHPTSEKPRHRKKFRFLYSIVDSTECYSVSDIERERLRTDLGIAVHRPALVYVGRFDTKKAQHAFIRQAVPVLRTARPDAVVYFVGDFDPSHDPYAAACAREVESQSLSEYVRFVGYSSRMADWYRAADVVLLASQREGLPRCIIEGIACGAPVVSFAVCSAREVLEMHDCGVVVPLGDYQRMSVEIADLLQDPERGASYRRRGPAIASQLFDANRNARSYSELVQELLH